MKTENDDGKRWWWVSYEDNSQPKGQRAIGAVIVKHAGGFEAVVEYIDRELNLAPQLKSELHLGAYGGMMRWEMGDPPASMAGRFLRPSEAARLAVEWGGGVMTQEEKEAAVAAASRGDAER